MDINIQPIVEKNIKTTSEEQWKIETVENFKKDIVVAFKEERLIEINNLSEWHRGIGKTSLIRDLAIMFSLPILTKALKYDYVGVDKNNIVNNIEGLIGVRRNKYVLIDEYPITDEIYKKLMSIGMKPIGITSKRISYYTIM